MDACNTAETLGKVALGLQLQEEAAGLIEGVGKEQGRARVGARPTLIPHNTHGILAVEVESWCACLCLCKGVDPCGSSRVLSHIN